MSRHIPIINITQTGANPGTFTLGVTPDNASGDWTPVFQGSYYRDNSGNVQPLYSSPTPPAGYAIIVATQFDVVNNPRYSGRYTVYTTPTIGGLASSTAAPGQTVVRVNENIGAPLLPSDLTSGSVTNVSTYYIVYSSGFFVVPPGVDITSAPLDLVGRTFSGWGEVFTQNQVTTAIHFAGIVAPVNPLVGMLWWNTSTNLMSVWNGTTWSIVNAAVFAPAASFRFHQAAAALTWTVAHGLNSASPFIVNHSFFVDTGAGVFKPILPSDVTYIDPNTFSVTFSSAYAGYALVRL